MHKLKTMGLPAPVIAAGLQLIGQGGNALLQGAQNRRAREFAWNMYTQQRKDALADWNMQNAYDSPEAQMQRLQAAGLNPNLVYGKGADNTSAPVRTSSAPGWNPSAPKMELGGVVSSYLDTKIKEEQVANIAAQTANTQAATKNASMDSILKALDAIGKTTGNKMSALEYGKALELRDTAIENAKLQNDNLSTEIQVRLNRDEREAASTATSIAEAVERIMNLRSSRINDQATRAKIAQEIENMKSNKALMDKDLELRKQGIYPGDPAWWRIVGRVANNFPGIPDAVKSGHVKTGQGFGAQMGADWLNLFR